MKIPAHIWIQIKKFVQKNDKIKNVKLQHNKMRTSLLQKECISKVAK
jgi:hypothetical protein